MSDAAKPKLKELVLELRELTWSEVVQLAVQLEVDYPTLRKFEDKYTDDERRVLASMSCWLEANTAASWKTLVKALRAIEKKALAKKIKEKYRSLATQHAGHRKRREKYLSNVEIPSDSATSTSSSSVEIPSVKRFCMIVCRVLFSQLPYRKKMEQQNEDSNSTHFKVLWLLPTINF